MRRALIGMLIVCSEAALADKETGYQNRLALLPIVTAGSYGEASLSTIFDDIASVTSRRLGLRLISIEEMSAIGQELTRPVIECGADERCIASKLNHFNARIGLVIALDFAVDPPVISAKLLDTDEQRLLAKALGELPPNDPEQISLGIRRITDEVLERAGYVLAGRIVVAVEPKNAIVRLHGGTEPDKGTPNVFTVAPGTYRVTGEAEGYEPGETEVEVTGGATTQVSFELSDQTSILENPWLWVGVGALVAAGVTTGVVVGTRKKEVCLCLTLGPEECRCP